jgi:cytochrome c oxidase subunit 3
MDAGGIPYTIEPRGDTRVNNVTLGIWLFLASEVMLFGALFSAYALLRVAAPQWPRGATVLNVGAGLANTAVLVAGAFGVWRARAGGAARRWLWLGVAAAAVFLGVKGLEWAHEISLGLVPSTDTFLATYYTLTGLHAAHVAGGLVANLCVLAAARRAGDAMTANRIRALSLYWTFIDVVWLAILGTMYLS